MLLIQYEYYGFACGAGLAGRIQISYFCKYSIHLILPPKKTSKEKKVGCQGEGFLFCSR